MIWLLPHLSLEIYLFYLPWGINKSIGYPTLWSLATDEILFYL